jgi:hypothetical protein
MDSKASPLVTEPASVYRVAATFIAWAAGIILLAHAVEVAYFGVPNWGALAIRVAWCSVLLVVAAMLRSPQRGVVVAGTAIGIAASAVLDLAIVAVTGRSSSPLLAFTPVLALVLPFVAFDMIRLGLAGSAFLLVGTGIMLALDGSSPGSLIILANAGGGALACGWLLARALERTRRAESAQRAELAEAMANVKTLKGLLPVCAWCRRVRGDAGYWQQIESYITAHSDATITHSLCQECATTHFPDVVGEPEIDLAGSAQPAPDV